MRKTFIAGLAGATIALTVLPAAADEIPNLVGTWKGTAKAVHVGSTPYRVANGNAAAFGGDLEFTYVIKEQQDSRFTGETEGKFTEKFLGALQPPNYASGIFIDDDGEYSFTLRDATTMDTCYRHIYPTSKVVACFTLTKQP
jgi:hypothetical protein